MNSGIDYTAWRFWWDVLQTCFLAAITIYIWWVNRDRVTQSRITQLKDDTAKTVGGIRQEIGELATRLTRVEADCCHMPGHDDLGKIYERINGVSAEVADVSSEISEVSGEMKAMRRSLDLITQHLMEEKR